MITREDIPCRYEISWRGNDTPPAVVLRVHRDFAAHAKPLPSTSPILSVLKRELECENFLTEFSTDFGFDGALKHLGESGEFVEFRAEMPSVRKETEAVCKECNGLGEDTDLGIDCLHCDKTGKEIRYDFRQASLVSASLTIFFQMAWMLEEETRASLPQLMLVETKIGNSGGVGIWGAYSIPLVQWLSAFVPGTSLPRMEEAMKVAYQHMFGPSNLSDFFFRASVDSTGGWLNVTCPGNGCGLNPKYNSVGRAGGYEFSDHNVDGTVQQLTLLAGLAALHDQARKEIRP